MSTTESRSVAPDAVRVWRGFRLPALSLDDFYAKLGTVFIPATVKLQIEAGLSSYSPTVPGGLPGKPDTVPDETAILFWESPATYWNGFTQLAVRTYTLTHGGVYAPGSGAAFPVPFAGSLTSDQPVFLFPQSADWMGGSTRHFVAARPPALDVATFHAAVSAVLQKIQALPLNGAIACAGDNYVVYWELGPIAPPPPAPPPPSGVPLLQAVLTAWSQEFLPAATFLPIGLWDEWIGMNVGAGSSFNMQFQRRGAR